MAIPVLPDEQLPPKIVDKIEPAVVNSFMEAKLFIWHHSKSRKILQQTNHKYFASLLISSKYLGVTIPLI